MLFKIQENINDKQYPFVLIVNGKLFDMYANITKALEAAENIFQANCSAFQIVRQKGGNYSFNYLRMEQKC